MGNHKSNLLRSATVFQNVDYYLKKRHLFSSCNDDPAENYLLFGCTVSLQHADVLKYQMHNLQQQQNYLKLQFPRIITVITLIINRTGQKLSMFPPNRLSFPTEERGNGL